MSRTWHVATDDIFSLKIALGNADLGLNTSTTAFSNGGADVGNGAATTFTAAIELKSGLFIPLTFNRGQSSITVADLGVGWSDYSKPIFISNGTGFWIRIWSTSTAGIHFCVRADSTNNEKMTYAATAPDQTLGGTITDTTPNTYSRPPLAIVGMTRNPSVGILGDSIGWGLKEKTGGGTLAGTVDYLQGIIARSFPTNLAFLNLSMASAAPSTFVSLSPTRVAMLPYFTHLVSQLGINQLYSGQIYSDTGAHTLGFLQKIWALCAPDCLITASTLPPVIQSTSDSLTTLGGQTVDANDAQRVVYNNLIRGGAVGVNNGYFEVADVLETSRDSGKYVFDGTVFHWIDSDHIHPNLAGSNLVVSAGSVNVTKMLHRP